MATVNTKSDKLMVIGLCLLALLVDLRGQEPEIVKLTVAKDKVVTWCPLDKKNISSCSKTQARLLIKTVVKGREPKPEEFNFVITGGQIERDGNAVYWNLAEAVPGKHSLTVGLGTGGVIRGKTVSSTVDVEECGACDLPCFCFSLELNPPTNRVSQGDAFIVEARVTGEDSERATYKWTVSEGTIVEGQRTSRILIRTDPKSKSKNITVRVEVGGNDPTCNCPNFATEEITIAQPAT